MQLYVSLSPPYFCDHTFHYAVDVTSHTGRNPHHLFVVPRVISRVNIINSW